jgi:AraC family transcriptional regulator of adaptative response/methylated-DNA-[protein]-cysteine methyltransferase
MDQSCTTETGRPVCAQTAVSTSMHTSALASAETSGASGRHYELVARAIRYLRNNFRAGTQPTLTELAEAVHLSEFHLQRVFTAWAGISPKRFLQYLSKEHALQALRSAEDMLSATHAGGLSSPGRLHDLMVSCEAMTPGEIKRGGAGVTVGWGQAETPFGTALLGWTPRGLCHLAFLDSGDDNAARARQAELESLWPAATLQRDDETALHWMQRVFSTSASMQAPAPVPNQPLHLLLRGTNFQLKVWEALLRLPPGQPLSYTQLARLAGVPKAGRAVGSALAANTIGWLIPCHRVIRESGDINHYRWGPERKAAMLVWEAARHGQTG